VQVVGVVGTTGGGASVPQPAEITPSI